MSRIGMKKMPCNGLRPCDPKSWLFEIALALLITLVAVRISSAQRPGPTISIVDPADNKPREPHVHLGQVPALKLGTRPAIDPQRIERIKKCIKDLAAIEKPDFGFSAMTNTTAFLPLADRLEPSWVTDHEVLHSQALRSLVEMGPDSLPFLLAALDDKTPTKLTVEPQGGMGMMIAANELDGNPANLLESRVLGRSEALPWSLLVDSFNKKLPNGITTESYTEKVGDICFVAIGQIVGRAYRAVRYQSTGFVIVNSPTARAELRTKVRSIWSSEDARKRVFDSLLVDYATQESATQGRLVDPLSVDGLSQATRLQAQAATRLLYYFPNETSQVIAERIHSLPIDGKTPRPNAENAQVGHRRAVELVKAASWCKEPVIRRVIRQVFERTSDVEVFLEALHGLCDVEEGLVRLRIESLLRNTPALENDYLGDGYKLLVVAGQRLGIAAKPLYQEYLKDACSQRRHTMCMVLWQTNQALSAELLGPFLDDKEDVKPYCAHYASQNGMAVAVFRVCDAAAQTLAHNYREIEFDILGTHQDLDPRLGAVKQKLANGKLTLR
jgi:hypothetical protein